VGEPPGPGPEGARDPRPQHGRVRVRRDADRLEVGLDEGHPEPLGHLEAGPTADAPGDEVGPLAAGERLPHPRLHHPRKLAGREEHAGDGAAFRDAARCAQNGLQLARQGRHRDRGVAEHRGQVARRDGLHLVPRVTKSDGEGDVGLDAASGVVADDRDAHRGPRPYCNLELQTYASTGPEEGIDMASAITPLARASPRPRRQASIAFILITIFLDVLGIGLIIPVLPQLITELSGGGVSDAARVYGLFVAAYAAMQFLFAPCSARSPTASAAAPCCCCRCSARASTTWSWASPRAWHGCSPPPGRRPHRGQHHRRERLHRRHHPPADRAKRFGLIGAAFGLGFIVAPAVGGLLGSYGLRLPSSRPRRSCC
jgi:hypothetical protein